MCENSGCIIDIRYMQRCSQRPVFTFSSKISYLIYKKMNTGRVAFRTKFRGNRVIQDNLINYIQSGLRAEKLTSLLDCCLLFWMSQFVRTFRPMVVGQRGVWACSKKHKQLDTLLETGCCRVEIKHWGGTYSFGPGTLSCFQSLDPRDWWKFCLTCPTE
jgi:hypothetical protein